MPGKSELLCRLPARWSTERGRDTPWGCPRRISGRPRPGPAAGGGLCGPGGGRGQTYRAVTNVGTRPSVDSDSRKTVESLLLDYRGDLYGKEMALTFYRRLRGIENSPPSRR